MTSVSMMPLPERQGISDEERDLAQKFRERYASYFEGLIVRQKVDEPKITLIVISFKAQDYLLDCLRHLRAQTVAREIPYEILLADSGGLDHLRDRYGNLVDVDLRLRYGLPLNVARNAAMAYARSELVAIIDDDGLVAPDWVEQAFKVFRDPTIGVARGRILPHKHPYYNAFTGHYDRGEELWDEGSCALEGNMVIRRNLYLAVGGFPDEFYGSEGMYLSYRLAEAFPDKRNVYAPGLLMRHDYCRSLREFIWKARKYYEVAEKHEAADPGFKAYRKTYWQKPKPLPNRTLDERIARQILLNAHKVISRVSLFDRVKRR
jgi:glycosyltransferase involved in cell wall biosynthesis